MITAPIAQPTASTDARIALLESALVEALVGLSVNGQAGPLLKVPCCIGVDGWRWSQVKGRRQAIEVIQAAVKQAGTFPETRR